MINSEELVNELTKKIQQLKRNNKTVGLTDSEKLDILSQRIKRMEYSQHIQTAIVIIGFLGIISFGALLVKFKKSINGIVK